MARTLPSIRRLQAMCPGKCIKANAGETGTSTQSILAAPSNDIGIAGKAGCPPMSYWCAIFMGSSDGVLRAMREARMIRVLSRLLDYHRHYRVASVCWVTRVSQTPLRYLRRTEMYAITSQSSPQMRMRRKICSNYSTFAIHR